MSNVKKLPFLQKAFQQEGKEIREGVELAIIKDSPELLLKNKVDFYDRLIVGFPKCSDGFRLTNLKGSFHYQRLPFWIVFPIKKVLVYLPF